MHEECLTLEAKRLFPELTRFKGYHLVGGTALALQIGHRISYDFDLFTEQPLSEHIFRRAKAVFKGEKIRLSFRSREQLDIYVSGVKTTFRYYPYPPLYLCTHYKRVPLLSIKDIAASKAYAIGQRTAYRDYVDVYFILKEGHATLTEIVTTAEKKYKTDFNGRLFLEQLVYLGDIHDTTVSFLRHPVTEKQLIVYLKKEVKDYIKHFAT